MSIQDMLSYVQKELWIGEMYLVLMIIEKYFKYLNKSRIKIIIKNQLGWH